MSAYTLHVRRDDTGTTIEVKDEGGTAVLVETPAEYIDELYCFDHIRVVYGLEEPPHIKLTGAEFKYGGWTPSFDIVNHGRVMAQAGAGHRFATEAEAMDAGRRAVDYFAANGCFPNMCDKF